MPVEAQAAGVPVIAFGRGGVRDTVRDGETGVLFGEQTVESVCAAIERFEGLDFDEQVLREHARSFAPERFRERMTELLLEAEGWMMSPNPEQKVNR